MRRDIPWRDNCHQEGIPSTHELDGYACSSKAMAGNFAVMGSDNANANANDNDNEAIKGVRIKSPS